MKAILLHVKRNISQIIGLFALFVLYFASSSLPVLRNYPGIVDKVVFVLAYLVAGWILARIVNYSFSRALNRKYAITKEDNLHERRMQTKIRYIKAMLNIVIWLIVLALIFSLFDTLKTIGSSILISAGITSVIIGFAAQKSISNLIAGFQIAFTQPIRIDDAVFVEGQWGWIEELTLTYVVVRIWDKRRLVLPISYFVENPFQNWTKNSADILGSVFLYTDYSVPVNELREELTRILKTTELWDGKVGIIQVTSTTEKCVELRVLVSAKNSPDNWDLRCLVREQLVSFLKQNYPESLPVLRAEVKNA